MGRIYCHCRSKELPNINVLSYAIIRHNYDELSSICIEDTEKRYFCPKGKVDMKLYINLSKRNFE